MPPLGWAGHLLSRLQCWRPAQQVAVSPLLPAHEHAQQTPPLIKHSSREPVVTSQPFSTPELEAAFSPSGELALMCLRDSTCHVTALQLLTLLQQFKIRAPPPPPPLGIPAWYPCGWGFPQTAPSSLLLGATMLVSCCTPFNIPQHSRWLAAWPGGLPGPFSRHAAAEG